MLFFSAKDYQRLYPTCSLPISKDSKLDGTLKVYRALTHHHVPAHFKPPSLVVCGFINEEKFRGVRLILAIWCRLNLPTSFRASPSAGVTSFLSPWWNVWILPSLSMAGFWLALVSLLRLIECLALNWQNHHSETRDLVYFLHGLYCSNFKPMTRHSQPFLSQFLKLLHNNFLHFLIVALCWHAGNVCYS